ncbi:hypothetical protein PV326_005185 [Microctonus aethiopoides]|uniref:Uncharacterized protein n=1 Tax=Microctonus aethiopoides TaxID=144406 RepID=A0AA39FK31_9HYME|nr:hypothetical protein PV326_005185 [Microctonus aethiopoides]KAK0171060.1 hypothetical protein PV328_008824 [Microctonus aethiopoides]
MNITNRIGLSSAIDLSSSTTASTLITDEEKEDVILTIVIIIGAIVAIIVLCSMGIFIDCLHQNETSKKKLPRIKLPPFSRRRNRKDDKRSLTADMGPTDVNNLETNTTVVVI